MRKIKNSTIFAIILTILVIGIHTNIYAAGIGMSINKSSAYVGDTFSVTISGINGKVSISGNSNVSLSTSGTKWVEGSMTITGTAKSVGTGTITITPIDASTTGADPVEVTKAVSKSITIKEKEAELQPQPTQTPSTTTKNTTSNAKTTTKTETKRAETEKQQEDDFYISDITLKGIKENGEQVEIELSPEFNKDTYEYTCNITSDIQKIDLQKDAGDYTDSVIVTGLDELAEGENIIKLLLSAEDHESKTYTIKVIKEESKESIADVSEQEENINRNKEKAETKMISMPVYAFIIMQIIIIAIEIIVIYFIPWKKIIKKKN